MACEECRIAASGSHNRFCLKCPWCGARLIKAIQSLAIPPSEKSARCKVVITDWVAYGHDEQFVRGLAKEPNIPLEPKDHNRAPRKTKAKKK